MKAADEPAYLTVGTDVSAKYRGAFCEAKIKTVKRLVKVKVTLKQDHSIQLVQDDQVKGPLRVGATVEMKAPDGSQQEATISKLTDASWYTVVFDDGDERTLRRTSLCLKGERHFAESETLDQLPLTNPEHFGTPVIGKKSNRGRRSSLPVTEDEKEDSSSEEEDDDVKRIGDELLGKVVNVNCSLTNECYPAVVVSPSCNDETSVKKDQCLVRSFADAKFHSVARKDLEELDINALNLESCSKPGLTEATAFLKSRSVPDSWKMDMSEILESSSSDEDDGEADGSDGERNKVEEEEAEPEEEADPAERDNFLQQLYKFMEDRGTPINKPPVLGYKDLNLFKLFRLVYHQGGCDNIESGGVWKQIYMDLGIPILNSAASYNVKTAYKKYLYGFEEYCRSADIKFRTIHHNDPQPVEESPTLEVSMENSDQPEPETPPVSVSVKEDDDSDSSSDNEKEVIEMKSLRERRRPVSSTNSSTKDQEDSEKMNESNKENKDMEEDDDRPEEQKENDTPPGRRSLTSQGKDLRSQKQEDSERESDEEDDKLSDVYDEWVKADRIIWPSEKVGSKRKQKKRTKNKDENDKDEKREEEKQKAKGRGRPPLKSQLQSNVTCTVPKTPNSEGKASGTNTKNNTLDNSSLSNGLEGTVRRRTRRSSGLYDSDRCSNDSSTSDSESEENTETVPEKEEEPLPNVEKESEQKPESPPEKIPEPEVAQVICPVKEQENSPIKPAEMLKQEVEESEQIVQIYGKQTEQFEEIKKDAENLPKPKGRRSKTKEPSPENLKTPPAPQEDTVLEPREEPETLDFVAFATLQSKECPLSPKDVDLPNDPLTKEKKGFKRKPVEQTSPEKKPRTECDLELPVITPEEKPTEICETQENFDAIKEEELHNVNYEMPSLTAELEHVQSIRTEGYDVQLNDITGMSQKEEQDDAMPMIGPETLVCHEVDLDDFDEKDKLEDIPIEKAEPETQTLLVPTLPPAVQTHSYSVASPLALSHDESHSIKSESDITIEVDSVAEESQEGLCESESANGFEASTTSSNCSMTAQQEAELRDKGHKRISESNLGTLAKKQKRTPKRLSASLKIEKNGIGQSSDSEDLSALDSSSKCTAVKHTNIPKPQKITRSPARITSPHIKDIEKDKHREKHQHSPRAYKWTFPLNELETMSGTERIVFLQDKLQEIRKYYMSLKSEVATIDRRRKRLKKKDREISNTGASMSSASSETGMSPSSSSPPQNTLALECR
ncbi:AT-rich interactive domain-containing protein 4A isoform X3 [Lithobates pipiens]